MIKTILNIYSFTPVNISSMIIVSTHNSFFRCFSVLFYMCNCYWYTFINVHALFLLGQDTCVSGIDFASVYTIVLSDIRTVLSVWSCKTGFVVPSYCMTILENRKTKLSLVGDLHINLSENMYN